jgi:hypothetical protein
MKNEQIKQPSKERVCDDLLAQKRLQLKAARRESKKAALQGRHNWGDFLRNQHIKELEREIQILRANEIAEP